MIMTLLVFIISGLMASNFITPIPVKVLSDLRCGTTGSNVLQFCPNVGGVKSECIAEQVHSLLPIDQRMQCSVSFET